MKKDPPKTVDEYLARIDSDGARASLTRLRAVIREAAPEAEEVISYGVPTYKFHGFVCSLASFKNHCSFFPGHTVADFADQLKGYKLAKGTVRFPHDKPLPDSLVIAIVKARLADNLAASKK